MAVNEKVKVIGLTGMSGAGKTTACRAFMEEGFEILDCDRICRDIVKKGSKCLTEITEAFGAAVLDCNGCLNRTEMGRIIFSDSVQRLKLNRIMYPFVSYIIIKRIINMNVGFIILDAPTLFDSGLESICDSIVSVVADRKVSLERITERDAINPEAAEKRLSSQHGIEYYADRSDYLIKNNGSLEEFFVRIMKTIKSIKEGQ